ncbi:hypothetical protein GYMLUDRAFT_44662 [Collybiopsis luxurians FD-317 M1]|uniref:Unplaced genomic scaffold GYMLUscaffold_32, whole genome shotgun sequence n=1 Tax=Collybiopsis luxurians FD-317 M1 TaxID=944289 RepID=A0A0D0CL74_9AGAR|nr:hypothetical protein GYMLUDRAFT_44662 [Collybiopsis luxurians FD-317 M1]
MQIFVKILTVSCLQQCLEAEIEDKKGIPTDSVVSGFWLKSARRWPNLLCLCGDTRIFAKTLTGKASALEKEDSSPEQHHLIHPRRQAA